MRQLIRLLRMLHLYFFQHCFSLSSEGLKVAICDSRSIHRCRLALQAAMSLNMCSPFAGTPRAVQPRWKSLKLS